MHPQPPRATSTQDNADAGGAAGTRPAILLVEDEPTTRLMVSRLLERAGYEVVAAANGVEALAALNRRFIPLMLTDWDMPQMNGLALCQAVRKLPLEGYVYTILLTARESKADIIAGLTAGADDYLTKPPDESELRARLNTGRRILDLEQSLRAANRRIQQLSITDALTMTFNRRYLMENLPLEFARACREHLSLSVVLCDIDHFKAVNDTYGHQSGDDVLRSVAMRIGNALRPDIDWVARYGGEEFLIVLPETTVAEAIEAAEKIRLAIATQPLEINRGTISVHASFGVSGFDFVRAPSTGGVDALIAGADTCLYRSKTQGRNRVTGQALDQPSARDRDDSVQATFD